MPVTPSDRRTADVRREELIDAAIAILVTDGYLALTTRRITQQAGVALGAFHYVFRNKAAMLEAVISRTADGAGQVLLDAVDPLQSDVLAIAEQLIRAYWSHVTSMPDRELAQFELIVHALRDPDLQHLADHQQEASTRAVTAVFDRLPRVIPTDVRTDLARYLVAVMDGLVLHHVVQRDVAAGARRLELFIATLPAVLVASDGSSRARFVTSPG